jgi:hypothetical protein
MKTEIEEARARLTRARAAWDKARQATADMEMRMWRLENEAARECFAVMMNSASKALEWGEAKKELEKLLAAEEEQEK